MCGFYWSNFKNKQKNEKMGPVISGQRDLCEFEL